MTIRELRKITKGKDPNAEVRITEWNNKTGETHRFYINRACNLDWQKMNNMVLFTKGIMDRSKVKNF